jgi:hypothetical protein
MNTIRIREVVSSSTLLEGLLSLCLRLEKIELPIAGVGLCLSMFISFGYKLYKQGNSKSKKPLPLSLFIFRRHDEAKFCALSSIFFVFSMFKDKWLYNKYKYKRYILNTQIHVVI